MSESVFNKSVYENVSPTQLLHLTNNNTFEVTHHCELEVIISLLYYGVRETLAHAALPHWLPQQDPLHLWGPTLLISSHNSRCFRRIDCSLCMNVRTHLACALKSTVNVFWNHPLSGLPPEAECQRFGLLRLNFWYAALFYIMQSHFSPLALPIMSSAE